jgi:hypothetical protein
MKEVIIVAGENKFDIERLRDRLREEGYSSTACEMAEEIIEELSIMPICSVHVPLVVIEPGILKDISDDLVDRLSECAPDVPFTLLAGADLEGDLAEKFELICAHRAKFEWEGNPLAKTLEEAGVEVTCG